MKDKNEGLKLVVGTVVMYIAYLLIAHYSGIGIRPMMNPLPF